MTYPYIGKGKGSGSIVLFYEQNKGVTLESKSWSSENLQYSNGINEDLFKNITADYLRNTKVKIESEEHEIFIKKIVYDAGLMSWVSDGYVFIFDIDMETVSRVITLPLPPKESGEWPQLGGEVSFPSGKGILVVDKPDTNGVVIVRSTDADSIGEYKKVSLGALKKPPKPEEDLRDKLIKAMDNSNTAFQYADYLSKAIIKGEIKGLSYKPE